MILGSSASSTYEGIIRIQDRNLVILGSSASTSDGIIQDPGPKSGRRITGGGSYVTVCLVTLTTIPLARISPFPLVPSNGIICSNSASASCLLVRQFPRGTSTSPHMSQHARIGDPTAARGASLSNHLLWNITSTSLFRFSRFPNPSYRKLL